MSEKEIKALWAAIDSLLDAGAISEEQHSRLVKRLGLAP